jgi:hypothetical protein
LLARVVLIIEDLVGVPQIVKSTSGLAFGRKKTDALASDMPVNPNAGQPN